MAERLRQYNIEFDQKETDLPYNRIQLETHLRERFNALLSVVEYGIVDGHLVRMGTNEPFVNSIARGRDHIRSVGPNPVDFAREDAEVEGFGNIIDPFLSNPDTQLGAKVLSISPKGDEGSRYGHNFYDIFTLKRENGKRLVELRRYSSALSPQEYTQKDLLTGVYSQNPTAEEFLANPKPIENIFLTAEQIHMEFHKEHDYMKEGEFLAIWNSRTVQDRVDAYLFRKDAGNFNAILNSADDVWEQNKRRSRGEKYFDLDANSASSDVVNYWRSKEVRQAAGGCPGKSGAEENSVFSVSDFGSKDRGYDFDHEGTCAVCNGGPKKLGPCEICEDCVEDIEAKEEAGIAA